MLSYEIEVKGYAAERNLYRKEIIGQKNYAKQIETTKRDEYTDTDLEEVKQEEKTKTKMEDVVAFPESEEEIINIIEKEAPYRIAGMLKAVSKSITPRNKPPKGRRGITTPLEFWDVELENLELTDVQRTQFLQLHGLVGGRGGALHEYGDYADFKATLNVWTPALDYKDAEPIVRRIIKLGRLKGFGPFRRARMFFLNGI